MKNETTGNDRTRISLNSKSLTFFASILGLTWISYRLLDRRGRSLLTRVIGSYLLLIGSDLDIKQDGILKDVYVVDKRIL